MTLLELAAAVLVLAIGTLAVMKAMDQSRRALGAAVPRLMAQAAAENRAEELRLLGLAQGRSLPRTVQMGPHRITLSLQSRTTAAGVLRVEITARAGNGSGNGAGAYLVTYLPPDAGARR
jgi:general secretion pathway protein I